MDTRHREKGGKKSRRKEKTRNLKVKSNHLSFITIIIIRSSIPHVFRMIIRIFITLHVTITTSPKPPHSPPIPRSPPLPLPTPPLPLQPLHQHRRLIRASPTLFLFSLLWLLRSNRHPTMEELNRIRVREAGDSPGVMARMEHRIDYCLRVAF